MHRMKSRFYGAILVGILLLLAGSLVYWLRGPADESAVENPASRPVELVWSHHFGEEGSRKWLDIGAQRFRERYPNVTFKMLPIDGGDYVSFLRTKAVAGEMPDLYMIDNIDGTYDLIEAGYATDLTDQSFLGNVDSAYLQGVKTSDGRIWALPIDVNGVGITYNKSVFAKAGIKNPPATWSEFLSVCRRLAAAGYVPIASGFQETWTLSWDLNADLIATVLTKDPFFIQKVEQGSATFSDPSSGFGETLARLGQRYAYMNPQPFETDWNEALDMMGSGRAGMIINGTWSVDGVRSKYSEADIGLFAFPHSEDPGLNRFALKSTGGIVVNPRSPNKAEALKVLSLFAEEEMGTVLQQHKKSFSVIKGLKPDFDPAFYELDKQYRKPGRVIDWSSLDTSFKNQELGNAFVTGITEFLLDPRHDVALALRRMDDMFNQMRTSVSSEKGKMP